jgi:hypothetical protein
MHTTHSEISVREVAHRAASSLFGPFERKPPATRAKRRHDTARAYEISPLALEQLTWDARRALKAVARHSSIALRRFDLADRSVILLAATVPHGRRVPRDAALIRRSLELGTGVQLRAIGRLAVVAIELPFAREAQS